MKDLKSLQDEYSQIKVHKDLYFCHSMNVEGYKILYKNYFADETNKAAALRIADETISSSLESEKFFLQWLNVEWYD